MTDDAAREELEMIVRNGVNFLGEKSMMNMLMDWHRRHAQPAQAKVWPCPHTCQIYDSWMVRQGNNWTPAGDWSICPVAGCGARRPVAEEEKPVEDSQSGLTGFPGCLEPRKIRNPKPAPQETEQAPPASEPKALPPAQGGEWCKGHEASRQDADGWHPMTLFFGGRTQPCHLCAAPRPTPERGEPTPEWVKPTPEWVKPTEEEVEALAKELRKA